MKNVALSLVICLGALGAGSGCSVLSNEEIPYDVPPQEVLQDISQALSGLSGTFPTVDCTASASLCSMAGTPPASATITCDTSATTPGKSACALHYDLTIHQTINLSQEANFPTAVTDSPAISLVTLDDVGYWAGPAEMLNVATPPLDIYIGGMTATAPTDSGVQQLGTIGSIPPGTAPSTAPDCTKGAATSMSTACDLQLTPTGTQVFETLAKTFQTPFNIIVVGHLTVNGGEPVPQGKVDLFLQPQIGFHL
jgi:hypothetical protein